MDMYRAIVKMGQDGKADGIQVYSSADCFLRSCGIRLSEVLWSLQVTADRIQSELEELVKSLNEHCKSYGLRTKPTTLVELPFGTFSTFWYFIYLADL